MKNIEVGDALSNNNCSYKITQLNKKQRNGNHVQFVSPLTDDTLECKMRSLRTDSILRNKGGSYLLAAKGLLNKVSRMNHFIQLT